MQCLHVPDQIVNPVERCMRVFVSDNSLVPDPVEQMAYEHKLRPWSDDEKRIFNEKCLAHYKVRFVGLMASMLTSYLGSQKDFGLCLRGEEERMVVTFNCEGPSDISSATP